jgi:hypothetical protein
MPSIRFLPVRSLLWLGALALGAAAAAAQEQNVPIDLRGAVAPPAPGKPYAARTLPDRIVLSPGADPATTMQVSWRTDMAAQETRAELAELVPAPSRFPAAMSPQSARTARRAITKSPSPGSSPTPPMPTG